MLGAISGYSSYFSPVSFYNKPASGVQNPVEPVTPVKAEPTATANRSNGLIAGLSLPAMREGADPVEMAVRMRIQYPEEEAGNASVPNSAIGAEEAQKALEDGECQTCKERKYQDGSDDMGVSFQTPTNVDPDLAASAVRGHEMEHVVRERAKAEQEDRKVVSQSVTYHTAICPECGEAYVSGGTTRTTTRANPSQESQEVPETQGLEEDQDNRQMQGTQGTQKPQLVQGPQEDQDGRQAQGAQGNQNPQLIQGPQGVQPFQEQNKNRTPFEAVA